MNNNRDINYFNKDFNNQVEMITTIYLLVKHHSDTDSIRFHNKMINLWETNSSSLLMAHTILQELSKYSLKLPEYLACTSGKELKGYVSQFMSFYEYAITKKKHP